VSSGSRRQSEIASPPVQPLSASFSGIGAVATMSLATATTARASSGIFVAQAFSASTTASALTRPDGVRTTPSSRSRSTIGVRS
jgi:hypothetical protein